MNEILETPPTPQPIPSRSGLATSSLVIGLVACLLSLFVIGGIFGLAGMILGLLHILQKRGSNGMAWWGIGLSAVAILASVAVGVVALRMVRSTFMQSGPLQSWQGVAAPDISLTMLDGKVVKLSDLKGKRVVLDFWATWCGPCVEEIPEFVRLFRETPRSDLEIIGISDESEGTLKPFVADKAMTYPVVSAKNLPVPYSQIEAIPTTFFIDRKGVIQSILVGSRGFNDLKTHATAQDWQGQPKPAPQR